MTERRLHFKEAMKEAADRGELIVNLGDIVVQRSGDAAWFGLIAQYGDGHEDACLVCLLPARGDGHFSGTPMTGLRFMGWIEEFTHTELDVMSEEELEAAPGDGTAAYAVDAKVWRKFELPFWEWFRNASRHVRQEGHDL